MVNNRLTWYLESNIILTDLKSGFRRGRSTTDQLVRLESFVREAFVGGEHATAIFFDMEKAYDTTWKYDILQDLQNAGLGGACQRLSITSCRTVNTTSEWVPTSLTLTNKKWVFHKVAFFRL
jgi:hypothetical protein